MTKSKILILSTITLAIVVACAAMETKSKESNSGPHTVTEWDQKYPKVFTNSGYQSLIEPNTQLKSLQRLPESQQELIGTITNPFGIRDDVLDYILTNIPESNILVRKAAIKLYEIKTNIYFNSNPESAQKLAGLESLMYLCLFKELDAAKIDIKITDQIYHQFADTDKRKLYIDKIDTEYFAWKMIGSGLDSNAENKFCDAGQY